MIFHKSGFSSFEKESYIEWTGRDPKTIWFDTAKLAFLISEDSETLEIQRTFNISEKSRFSIFEKDVYIKIYIRDQVPAWFDASKQVFNVLNDC